MYQVGLGNTVRNNHTRDKVIWCQRRLMPRTRSDSKYDVNNGESVSTYLDEPRYRLSESTQEYDPHESVSESNREFVSASQRGVAEKQNSDEHETDLALKEMKARLRSKYQLHSETVNNEIVDLKPPENSNTESKIGKDHEDFFGVAEEIRFRHQQKEEALARGSYEKPIKSLSKEAIFDKYLDPLVRKETKSMERLVQATYGFIRMDEQKQPSSGEKKIKLQRHIRSETQDVAAEQVTDYGHLKRTEVQSVEYSSGQQSDRTRNDFPNEPASGSEFIDQQYFAYDGAYRPKGDDSEMSAVSDNSKSFIESQYFPDDTERVSTPVTDISQQYMSQSLHSPVRDSTSRVYDQSTDFDSDLYGKEINLQSRNEAQAHKAYSSDCAPPKENQIEKKPENNRITTSTSSWKPKKNSEIPTSTKNIFVEPAEPRNVKKEGTYEQENDRIGSSTPLINLKNDVESPVSSKNILADKYDLFKSVNEESDEEIFEQTGKRKQRLKPNLENPETAYDVAMKIRQEQKGRLQSSEDRKVAHESLKNWKGKLDSKGFRILKDQVVNLQYLTSDVVVNMLKESIIFQNEDLVVIDKPYGLPSHGGPGVHHSVGGLLPLLAEKIRDQKGPLYPIHRLDKETTGVMLLGRNPEVAWKIHGMFKRREVSKTYWALTKNVPNPRSGVIDIPMAEDEVKGRYRMGLRPHRDDNTRLLQGKAKNVKKSEAVTEYKVLSFISTAALVQCTPKTGIKHQIRCHLAFGLNAPIIGDHKYSHFSFIKPQKLHPEILNRLKIRQPTVRYLPMHLHARELVLPEFYNGKNTIFRSKLPDYFVRNMRWLKLAVPK